MNVIAIIGRACYALMFMISGYMHFTKVTINFAGTMGVPFAPFLVPFSGIIAILGAISITLGYKTRLGALLIIVFMIPVSVMMHPFWKETNPFAHQGQLFNFMKNICILGAAIHFFVTGADTASVDALANKPAK